MKTYTFIVVLILIALIITSVYFFGGEKTNIPFLPGSSEKTKSSSQSNTQEDSASKKINPPKKTSSDSGGGGSDSSGETSSFISGSASQNNCEERQISYSLTKFQKTSKCNEFSGQNCIDKTATCSIDVKNLDYNIGGTFTISFTFFDLKDESYIIQTTQVFYPIEPRNIKTFLSEINVQLPDSNKEISCSYITLEIPTKTVCSS